MERKHDARSSLSILSVSIADLDVLENMPRSLEGQIGDVFPEAFRLVRFLVRFPFQSSDPSGSYCVRFSTVVSQSQTKLPWETNTTAP